jgi:cyclohexanecarboxylate-CoA ligase
MEQSDIGVSKARTGFGVPMSARGEMGHRSYKAIDQYVKLASYRNPNKAAIIDRFGSLTWREVEDLSLRLATSLQNMGVKSGDRVAVQLPNWHHFPLLEYALSLIGAICVPLPLIYRERELSFMLDLVKPVLAFVPTIFRGFNHEAMFAQLQLLVPSIRKIVVVGEPSSKASINFNELLAASPFQGVGLTDASAITEIVFTSGTTGEPKGVMHSSNTNLYPAMSLIADQGLNSDAIILMASTFGHQTGFVYGGQLPAVLGATLVLIDRWDPITALELIKSEKVNWMMGATPFLQDLVESASNKDLDSLKTFLCSGAPIPPSLIAAARKRTSAFIASGWGMTEVGLVTLAKPGESDEAVSNSDGIPFDSMKIRITDEHGQAIVEGNEGELLCQGPSMFLGYYGRPKLTADSFTTDGWFRTGDMGKIDGSGHLRIVGRSKDIIIRGGENIPVVEVEDLLNQHPAIVRSAVVGIKDLRLQERACAVVILRIGEQLTFEEMRAHLLYFKMSKQYVPEHLFVVDEFPMTPSGKIQKFLLRRKITDLVEKSKESENAKMA